MPTNSLWMIRLSLIYLVAGFGIGAALLINKAYPIWPELWGLLPVHIELLIFGWIIQLTLGTANWILPKLQRRASQNTTKITTIMVVVLNMGILINITNHLFHLSEYSLLIGRLMELSAVLIFIALHWRRVLTFNS